MAYVGRYSILPSQRKLTPDTDPTGQYGVGTYGAPAPVPSMGAPYVPPPPSTTGSGGGGAPPVTTAPQQGSPSPSFDYSNDPVLMLIRQQGTGDLNAASANLLDAQKRALLGFGSQQLAQKVLGATDPFAQTVSDDPLSSMSTLAQINRRYSYDPMLRGGGWQMLENLNKQNLFYGGHRALEEADFGRQKVQEEAAAAQAIQDLLAQLQSSFLGTQRDVSSRNLQAEENAFMRAIERARQAPPVEEAGTSAEAPSAETMEPEVPTSAPVETEQFTEELRRRLMMAALTGQYGAL